MKINNKELYNPEIKERYFQFIKNESTRETVIYAFKKAVPTETILNKDVFEMNIDELWYLVAGMSASTVDSAYNYARIFQYYIDWAIHNGLTKSNINQFYLVEDHRVWAKELVATRKKSLFTREEILDMCEQLVNYPDRALLLSIFEGIRGEAFSELLNLQTKDLQEIDEKFYATLTNKDGEKRTIEISNNLFQLLHKADNAEVYYNRNGESESEKSSQSQFVDSPFIFKKLARGCKDGDIDAFYVRRKFKMFKTIFKAKYLTAKEIEVSGILHMVNEFIKNGDDITKENWEEIANKFNIPYIQGQGKRNISMLKRKVRDNTFRLIL